MMDEKKIFFLVNQVDARKNFFRESPALRLPALRAPALRAPALTLL